jgi:hypothetical protein
MMDRTRAKSIAEDGIIGAKAVRNLHHARAASANSKAIAEMFVAIFEGEVGDAGFIEIAEVFDDHAVVLFLGYADSAKSRLRLRASSHYCPLLP